MTIRRRSPRASARRPLHAPALALLLAAPGALAGCLAPDAIPGDEGGGAPGFDLLWANVYGASEPFNKHALSVAATPGGGALVAGEIDGGLAMPPLPALPLAEGRDGFVAAMSDGGVPAELRAFSGPGDQRVYNILSIPGGGVLVAGSFDTSLFYGGADEGQGVEGRDGFVARLSDDLSLDWVVRVGGPADQSVQALAVSSAGEYILAGYFQGALQVGSLSTGEQANGTDFFVAKLAPDGGALWGVSLGGTPVDAGSYFPICHLASAGDGGIHVAGTFTDTVLLGKNLGAVGDRDVFVGKLAADGSPLWAQSIGLPGSEQRAGGLAVNAAGVTVLSGEMRGDAQLGPSTTIRSDGPEDDAFLAVYGPSGELQWGRRYGSVAQDQGGAVAFDPAGNILFTGRYRGSIHFGTDLVLQNTGAVSGQDDVFLAALTPQGAPVRSTSFGKGDQQVASSVAATAAGDVLLAGWFRGIVDFGDGDHDAMEGEDMFVAKVAGPASQ